jgi:CubicO group peptidase (beta-lactamase class C family)
MPAGYDLFHTRVPRFPTAEVTSRNAAAEVAPRDVGMTDEDVSAIWAATVRLYETGLHPALALCVRRHGQIIIERAIGHVHGNAPGSPPDQPRRLVRHDTPFALFSASKAVTGMLIQLLDERRALKLDDPVVAYMPEFAPHGKHRITLRQLLIHRAGIPSLASFPGHRIEPGMLTDAPLILDLLCKSRPLSLPGRRLSYHALTSGFILAEVARRATGRDLRTLLRDELRTPLGFDSFDFGIAPARGAEVAENARTGWLTLPPATWLIERALGVSLEQAVDLSNHPAFLASVIPSCNVVGTAEEASRYFELLLNEGELGGVRIFDPHTVRRALSTRSELEMDSFIGLPIRYGMGFMLGHHRFSPYGPDTPSAFGHLGFTNVITYADPDRALSVGLLTSGKPFVTPGQLTWLNVPRTIARVCKRTRAR